MEQVQRRVEEAQRVPRGLDSVGLKTREQGRGLTGAALQGLAVDPAGDRAGVALTT